MELNRTVAVDAKRSLCRGTEALPVDCDGAALKCGSDDPQPHRRCGGCSVSLPPSAFARDRSKASGRKSRCRSCAGAQNAKWKQEHREHLAKKAWRRRNPGKPWPKSGAPSMGWWEEYELRRALDQLELLDPSLHLLPSKSCAGAESSQNDDDRYTGEHDGCWVPFWLRVEIAALLRRVMC